MWEHMDAYGHQQRPRAIPGFRSETPVEYKGQEKQFLLGPRWMSPTSKQHHWMVSTLPEDSTALSRITAPVW